MAKVMEAIRAQDLVKQVDSGGSPLTILDGVDLTIARGESLAIVGSSGSGKTTLLSLLAGLDRATRGEIWLDGQPMSALDEDARARLRAGRVGFVFQNFQLLPAFTALENVMLPIELAGQPQAERRARETLERVGLGQRLAHYPRQLSGGEQQRVALARAFAAEPQILFADEPTGSLDTHTGEQVVQLMFELNRDRGATLVLVTHDAGLAARCARQIRIREGRIDG